MCCEFMAVDTQALNGVVQRSLGLIQEAGMVADLEAQRLFPDTQLPASVHLWASYQRAYEAMKRTACDARPGKISPRKMLFEKVPLLT